MASPRAAVTAASDADFFALNQTNVLRDESDTVLRELHHRTKNTLTLLAAWLRLDFAPLHALNVREAIDQFEGRILAFGELYHLLSAGAGRGAISMGQYVGDLCRALSIAILAPNGLRCEVTAEDGLLDSRRCERLGLIITELVTNAAKHAFPGRGKGCVRIDTAYRDGCWHCVISDNGIGAHDACRGAGGQIVEDLARSIRAHITRKAGCPGTTVTIVVPN
jgi:two-component sensor histidine kinase